MKMRRQMRIAGLLAPGAVLAMALGAASAQAGQAERLCTWGGTPADPTGIVTLDPGFTNTPSAGPIAVYASGSLEGQGCNGRMIFDGIARAGASCESAIFEGPVYGLPGVTRLFGRGDATGTVEELLYDRQGNIVGADQPVAKTFGAGEGFSEGLDCNTPEGFRRAPFSSTVELYF